MRFRSVEVVGRLGGCGSPDVEVVGRLSLGGCGSPDGHQNIDFTVKFEDKKVPSFGDQKRSNLGLQK